MKTFKLNEIKQHKLVQRNNEKFNMNDELNFSINQESNFYDRIARILQRFFMTTRNYNFLVILLVIQVNKILVCANSIRLWLCISYN